MKRFLDTDLGVFTLIALISLVLTYPLPFQMTTHVPGWFNDGWDDSWAFVWTLWLAKEKILAGSFDFFFTNRIFYPDGVNLLHHTITVANGVIGFLPTILFGPVFTLNLLIIFSFILSAFGVYRLCFYISSERWGSFLAGLVFGFCPFRTSHAIEHLNLASTQWIPFFVLYLLKTRREPSLWNPVWVGVFFLLSLYSSWYYGIFLGIFGFIFILFSLETRIEKWLLKSVLASLVVGLGCLPILSNWPGTEGLENFSMGFWDSFRYSADLLGYGIPSTFHPLLGWMGKWGAEHFSYSEFEGTVYIGISVLILIGIGFKVGNIPNKIFWMFSSLFFFLLSLGPYLKVAGRYEFPLPGGLPLMVPLPFNALYRFPLMDALRTPGRFDVMFLLCACVAVPFGARWIVDKLNGGSLARTALAALILFEYLPTPIPTLPIAVNPFHRQIAADGERYSILDIPVSYEVRRYQFEQTIHGKDLVVAHVSRVPDSKRVLFADSDILVIGARPGRIGPRTIQEFNTDNFIRTVERHRIRYFVIHKFFIPAHEVGKLQIVFDNIKQVKRGYEDNELLVYEATSGWERSPEAGSTE